MKIRKKRRGFEAKKSLYGFCFIIPWLIGMIALFIIPLFKSIWYSCCDVGFGMEGGIVTDYIKFDNFNYIFKSDPDFVTNLTTSISDFAFRFPIVIVLSLIFAIILNQKFVGRTFARAIFFLPVIIATGVVMKSISSSTSGQPMMGDVSSVSGFSVASIDFGAVLANLDEPPNPIKPPLNWYPPQEGI